MPDSVDFIIDVSDEEIAREKRKARELRQSQWWKNRRGHGRCYYCGKAVPPRELTMDHVVPIIRGGKSTKSNVVPCCKPCNERKKYLLPIEWQEYLDALARKEPPK